jgi:hypothetical protein
MPRFSDVGTTFDSGSLSFDGFSSVADLCTFDSTLTTFDSTVRTFDQTTCQDVEQPAPSGGAGRKRKRFIVRDRGEMHLMRTWAEVEAYVESIKEVPKKRNKTRKPVKIEVTPELQRELYQHDLPNVATMLKSFDFDGLRMVMERLEAIQRDEEDVEMLLLA